MLQKNTIEDYFEEAKARLEIHFQKLIHENQQLKEKVKQLEAERDKSVLDAQQATKNERKRFREEI